jgi:transposase
MRRACAVVVIGVDSHKRTHTVVAVDGVGRRLGEKTVRANRDGHLELLRWAARFSDVTWAVEDCRNLTRRFEADMLAAGGRVVRVPTRLMAQARRAGRSPGKSDPIDAEAVAIAALRHPDLPVAELDGPAREVRLLSDYRRDLVRQRTRIASQVRWYVHELDPDLVVPPKGLRSQCVVDELATALATYDRLVARLAISLLVRCRELNGQINALDRELRRLVPVLAPSLLQIPGCGVVSASVIVGETAGVHRFRSKDAFARFTGTAPVPVWSGSSAGKVRLNRGGNRAMNHALHMIAVTQARGIGPGRGYLDKQLSRGKDKTAALRLLRRQLSDTVFSALRTDQTRTQTEPSSSANAA